MRDINKEQDKSGQETVQTQLECRMSHTIEEGNRIRRKEIVKDTQQ